MYEKWLTNKSIFFSWQTILLLILFFVFRAVSFLLTNHGIIQGILIFILLMILGILYFKKNEWAWYLVLGEIFLGGSGHYLELLGLSIRTLFIGFFIFMWLVHLVGQNKVRSSLLIHNKIIYYLISLGIIILYAFFNGYYHEHNFARIVGDSIPFAFLLLTFPAFHLFTEEKTQEFLVRLITVFIIGTAIFSLFTFFLFSSGLTQIHGEFYSWYRDVNLGKITDMANNFFRIVEPGHILIVPIILLISSLRMRAEKHNKMWLVFLFLASIILALNLSRGYFLALLVGLIVLKMKHTWKKWITESILTVLVIGIIFSGISFLASGGKTLGMEMFGLRISSMVQTKLEISTDTRMMILPEAVKMIFQNPIRGTGLGATVTFLNTKTYQMITTPQFDWGYLEMWIELGLIGAILVTGLYCVAIYLLAQKILIISDWHDFDVGILAGLASFLIMNITIPALFHIFGIIFLSLSLVVGIKHISIFDRTTTILYRIFNRL